MSSAFCHRILQGLWAAGVRDMVVTPGSRTTPLLLAALDSQLQLHSVIDERSAAFFALGRARARGTRVALLCTSGSAGAHYLPALLEARYAGHCLIALTADRPQELLHTGAHQTIDQRQLFDSACPPSIRIPAPNDSESTALAAGRRVHRAVSMAQGPVHINLAFRKPLEPVAGARVPEPVNLPTLHPTDEDVPTETTEKLLALCRATERGLIVAGPAFREGMGKALCSLASNLGFVLLAESSSGSRLRGETLEIRADGFTHLLEHSKWVRGLEPQLILQFGSDPASGPLGRWLSASSVRRIRFGEDRVLKAAKANTELIGGNGLQLCEALEAGALVPAPSEYRDAWKAADSHCWNIVQELLGQQRKELTEAMAVATVVRELAPIAQLTIGNSLPIRSLDSVVQGHEANVRVLHQRGTSGIEGLIAGAIGSSGSGPSALLIGDVSCAHDLASLALAQNAEGPLVIIVIDNGGGKIFSHLPAGKLNLPGERWRFWETPPDIDLSLVCQGYRVAHRLCESATELSDSLAWAKEQSGVTMLQVKVGPNSMRTFLRYVQDALA
ncbi:MAG: 2-succinyl-5-enolpyruvyl-6-hydroxy-3-cyclohexene-1-carboxylic-acid synthase [Myxococcales bacterium]|nr:2-succinyl-5-enolpyruvyl-6-hydroxy-3-cyclohexene-1-carboxylic-acid synthase [Myxococcales bacterium]